MGAWVLVDLHVCDVGEVVLFVQFLYMDFSSNFVCSSVSAMGQIFFMAEVQTSSAPIPSVVSKHFDVSLLCEGGSVKVTSTSFQKLNVSRYS